MAPSHYLIMNQCWLITKGVLWHSPESSFKKSAHQLNPYQVFRDYSFKIITSPRGQWVNNFSMPSREDMVWIKSISHTSSKQSQLFWASILSTWYNCICFKKHFGTRYFVFCNLSPPRMFLPLDLLSEYRIQHGTIRPLYVTSSYSTRIFYTGVSGFATDCPCGVWCNGLTTCLLYVGPLFGNRLLNNSWAVGLT